MSAFLESAWTRLRLELIAHAEGATGAYDSDGSGHQKPGSRPPKFPDRAGFDLDHFDRRWSRAKSDKARRSMLLCRDCADPKARVGGAVRCCVIGLLRSLMIANADPSKRRGTLEWREAIAKDRRPASDVALSYGVTKATVLDQRRKFDAVIQHGGSRNGAGRPRIQGFHD